MAVEKFETFEAFWPFYVKEHSIKATRTYHFIGTTAGLLLLLYILSTGNWKALPLVLVVSYSFAWFSHFFIEKNRPATFKYPFYSLMGDFRMYFLMLQGKMSAEVDRIVSKNI